MKSRFQKIKEMDINELAKFIDDMLEDDEDWFEKYYCDRCDSINNKFYCDVHGRCAFFKDVETMSVKDAIKAWLEENVE